MPISMLLMSLTLDVSKLSGWLNAYATCRVERRACDTGRGTAREAGGRWVAATQARHAQGLRVRLEAVGARAHAVGAHREHGPHVRDAGRVEAERLVELLRALPRSRTAGMRFTARCGPEGVRALGWLRHNRRARGGTDSQGCGSQGTRGAHVEHTVHIRDAGRVEAERMVELSHALPSRKAGMRRGKRYRPGGA